MKVYPVPGLLLRDPDKGDFVPENGREVLDSPYWWSRLSCGDAALTPPVAEVAEELPASAEAAPAEAAEELSPNAEPGSADAAYSDTEGAA